LENYNFCKVDTAEKIVGGIVARSNTPDLDGDVTTEKETWNALKNFMLGRRYIKINHKGEVRDIPVVESYFVESEHKKGDGILRQGDWYLGLYIGNEPEIWKAITEGDLNSFSMAGRANKE